MLTNLANWLCKIQAAVAMSFPHDLFMTDNQLNIMLKMLVNGFGYSWFLKDKSVFKRFETLVMVENLNKIKKALKAMIMCIF